MPAHTWTSLKSKIKSTFGNEAYNSLWKHIKEAKPNLWGEQQPRDYLEKTFVLALTKDLQGKGYDAVLKDNDVGLHLNHTTFQHNTKILRDLGKVWGQS